MVVNRKRIVVSSRALGFRVKVPFYIYDDVEELRTAARRFSGGEIDDDCIGVCQAYVFDDGYVSGVLVRLWREQIGTQVVSRGPPRHNGSLRICGSWRRSAASPRQRALRTSVQRHPRQACG